MSDKQTIFDWLEHNGSAPAPLLTVERSALSKYQFYLLARHYRRRLKIKPICLTYNRPDLSRVKAAIEEHSIFTDQSLYVLEGFYQRDLDRLALPPRTYVVAETDGGQLRAIPYSYRERRVILRTLLEQLAVGLHLRDLLKLDWSSMSGWEEYEPLLRTAKILRWTPEQLGEQLQSMQSGQILTLLKRSQFQAIFEMAEKYGSSWTWNHTIQLLADLLHYRAYRQMGYDAERTSRDLGFGWGKAKEMEDTNAMLTTADVDQLVDRVLKLDGLVQRNKDLGLALFMLNSPIGVRRR